MTYIVGSHWFICDVCGQKYRSTEKKKRWDGLVVCPADNEADHPQKYIRVESDGQAVPDPRPRPEDVFALPVYCTPVTRTAAADDGTADCMTVDYRLNINYRDYGAYQPIVLEPSTPTPILLDTFTAANGTDPTTRDMDVHPAAAGLSRWQTQGAPWSDGSIYSNAFINAASDYSTTSGALVFASADDSSSFVALGGCSVLVEVLTVAGGSSFTFQAYVSTGEQFQFALSGEQWSASTDGWSSPAISAVPGDVKACLHVDADGVCRLIVNGAVQATSSGVVIPSDINFASIGFVNVAGAYQSDAMLRSIAIYQGLTLAQATALTV